MHTIQNLRCLVLALATLGSAMAIELPAAAAEPASKAAAGQKEGEHIDATQLPHCQVSSRVIAIVATDGRDSLAVLSVPGAQEGGWQKLVRVGDPFAGAKVGHIGFKRVWLQSRSGWCQLTRTLPDAPSDGPTESTPPPPRSRPSAKPSPSPLPAELASSIRKRGENEFEVDRSVVDGIIEQQGTLLRGVQIVPKTENGKPVAVGLRGVRDGSLLHTLGLRSGDELQTINGFNIANPESALQAYAKLRTAEHLTLSVVRGGKPMSIDVAVK